MKKSYLAAVFAASSLVGAVLVPAGSAVAKSGNAAAVIKDEGCTGFIPTSGGGIGRLITTTKGHHRVTTKSGVAILTCHFRIPRDEAPVKPLRARGFECRVGATLSEDTSMMVAPGGRGLLVCKIRE